MGKTRKITFLAFLTIFFSTLLINGQKILNVVKAVTSWEQTDVNDDGQVNSADFIEAIPFYGQQVATPSPAPGTPTPTLTPGQWRDCSYCSFGTMLIAPPGGWPADWQTSANVLINANNLWGVKGMVATGGPSDQAKEWYGQLPGWTRGFIRGTYETVLNIPTGAAAFGMQDMYECFAYGPEYIHQAGSEAAQPGTYVPQAETAAEAAGKCLVYGPAVCDYEIMADPNIDIYSIGDEPTHTNACYYQVNPQDELLATNIAAVAPNVDIWMIQLAKYQTLVDRGSDFDGNPFTIDDFRAWLSQWVSWIKGANPNAQVWTQLGYGITDPMADYPNEPNCSAPQEPEYLLNFREALIDAGVDGVWVMPAQPCQPCPPGEDGTGGFPCSILNEDHNFYQQTLDNFQTAIGMACGQ
jgi:hypothetical protein